MKSDEQAIQGLLQQFESGWNRYDSVSLAAIFAEDANFIHIFGGQLDGGTAIAAAHRNIFERIVTFQNTKISAVPAAAEGAARLAT